VELDASGDAGDVGLAGFARGKSLALLLLRGLARPGRSRTKKADMRIFSEKAASARSSRSGESRDRAGRGGEGMREADPFPGVPAASTPAPVSWQMAW
jgi:hypothetical protein